MFDRTKSGLEIVNDLQFWSIWNTPAITIVEQSFGVFFRNSSQTEKFSQKLAYHSQTKKKTKYMPKWSPILVLTMVLVCLTSVIFPHCWLMLVLCTIEAFNLEILLSLSQKKNKVHCSSNLEISLPTFTQYKHGTKVMHFVFFQSGCDKAKNLTAFSVFLMVSKKL